MMPDDIPMYEKFEVRRMDGRDAPGERHHRCQYFALDLKHDPFARDAMERYADACEGTHPRLADSIRLWLATGQLEMLPWQSAQDLLLAEIDKKEEAMIAARERGQEDGK